MPKSGEFYSFDEVLRKMSIDEQKLKKLVSEGEIRAFREGSEMKFRKADIDTMDKTVPVKAAEDATAAIDLSAVQSAQASETLTDDLIFDEGDDVLDAETGMATAEISSQDTFVDEGVGMSTEPLEVDEDEPATMEVAPAGARKARPAAASVPSGRPARRAAPAEEAPMSIGWVLALSLSALVMIGAVFVTLDVAKSDDINVTAPADGFSMWVGENIGIPSPK